MPIGESANIERTPAASPYAHDRGSKSAAARSIMNSNARKASTACVRASRRERAQLPHTDRFSLNIVMVRRNHEPRATTAPSGCVD
jgi:hypothetical protein